MKCKFSRCIAFQHPEHRRVADFYRSVLDREQVAEEADSIELAGGQNRLFFDQGDHLGPVFELIVENAEAARDELARKGCQIVRWEGKGGCCYMRDPFGFVFNLWEDPAAFQ